MRKIALLLLCLFVVVCALSCGVTAPVGEYTPGINTEQGYSSEWIGIKFVPTENLYLSTDEEIQELLEISADMIYIDEKTGEEILDWARVTTVYEMMATDEYTGDSVIVMTEKITDAVAGVDEYIEALKYQIGTQTEINVSYSTTTKARIAGKEYTRFAYSLNFDGIEVGQAMYLRKVGDRMIAICVTADSEVAENALISCFKAN